MDFTELYQKNFPQMTKEEATSLHKTFSKYGVHPKWMFSEANLADEVIAQGDLFEGLYACFWATNGDGDYKVRTRENTEGIVLTNTCDNERNDYLTFIPLFPAPAYFLAANNTGRENDIKNNNVTTMIYLPETNTSTALVGDLSLSSTITREMFVQLKDKGTLKKKKSLTRDGYYFFLAKLTLHLMRPESNEISRESFKE